MKAISIIIIVAVIMAMGWYITFERLTSAKNQICVLEDEKSTLISQIEKFNKAEAKANEQIKQIKTVYIKDDCDCYNSPVPDGIIDIVRGTKN